VLKCLKLLAAVKTFETSCTPGCPSDLGIQRHRWQSELYIDHPRLSGTKLHKRDLITNAAAGRAPHFAIARFFDNAFAQMLVKSVNMGCQAQGFFCAEHSFQAAVTAAPRLHLQLHHPHLS
jgi:hypothetical protein